MWMMMIINVYWVCFQIYPFFIHVGRATIFGLEKIFILRKVTSYLFFMQCMPKGCINNQLDHVTSSYIVLGCVYLLLVLVALFFPYMSQLPVWLFFVVHLIYINGDSISKWVFHLIFFYGIEPHFLAISMSSTSSPSSSTINPLLPPPTPNAHAHNIVHLVSVKIGQNNYLTCNSSSDFPVTLCFWQV